MFTTGYEIEESKKKLYLVPLQPGRNSLVTKDKVKVKVDAIVGTMVINKSSGEAMNMHNSWIKLSYDSTNNVIAWRVRKELDNGQLQEHGWKFVAGNKDSGTIVLGVGRILTTFQHIEKKAYKDLEVKRYQDKTSAIDPEMYYFVEVKDA